MVRLPVLSGIFVALLFASAVGHERAWIDPATRSFRDAAGRHLILHGVNVVYKVPPYIPSDGAFDGELSLNDQDIKDLQSWGINLVRLGVMWEAVEIKPGVYDDVYLAKVDSLITKLGERGIYTLIDAHQDVWSRATCGEGIPNFYARAALKTGAYCFGGRISDAILGPIARHFGYCRSLESYGMRKDKEGNFLTEDCLNATAVFSDFYTSPEALTVAKALYNNVGGLQDLFISFWSHLSKRLAKNPHVLGFDPLNEPFASWSNPLQAVSRILPGRFDRTVLSHLYARIHAVNHAAEAQSILLFEPAIFPDDNPFGIQALGYRNPPGGNIGSGHHAVNSHTYCCELGSQKDSCANTGEPSNSSDSGKECRSYHEQNVGRRAADAKRLAIPLIVSEFGACMDSAVCTREIQQVADACDRHLASWAYWEFKTYHDITTSAGTGSEGVYTNGHLQIAKVKAIARTFVRAAQGTLSMARFDSVTGMFEAQMNVDTGIDTPTEIHALQEGKNGVAWYPNGYEVTILGPDGRELTPSQVNYASTTATNKFLFKIVDHTLSGKNVTISVKSKTLVNITAFTFNI